MSNSSISVVIPLFNKARYINRAVDSVLNQTFQNFEVVVINDGSTDNGPEIVRKICDSRIRLIDQKNTGVSAARNRGIREGESELIAFLDADDEWLPDFLETILGLAYCYPAAGAYATGYLLLKDGGNASRNITIKGEHEKCGCYFDLFHKGFGICSSSIVVRRTVFDKIGNFRVGYRLGEDLDMWFRIGLYYTFAYSPRICALYHYCQSNNAGRITKSIKVSPLYISLLRFEKDSHINPVVKSKAIKYLSYQLKKDIEYVFFNGFREIAMLRLQLYRKKFGVDLLYIKLYVLNMTPPFLLNLYIIIRLNLVRYVLKLKFLMCRYKYLGVFK